MNKHESKVHVPENGASKQEDIQFPKTKLSLF